MTTSKNYQVGDQTFKGGLIALFFYFADRYSIDPALIVILTPMLTALLAFLSAKVGDKELASFFSHNQEKVD